MHKIKHMGLVPKERRWGEIRRVPFEGGMILGRRLMVNKLGTSKSRGFAAEGRPSRTNQGSEALQNVEHHHGLLKAASIIIIVPKPCFWKASPFGEFVI